MDDDDFEIDFTFRPPPVSEYKMVLTSPEHMDALKAERDALRAVLGHLVLDDGPWLVRNSAGLLVCLRCEGAPAHPGEFTHADDCPILAGRALLNKESN